MYLVLGFQNLHSSTRNGVSIWNCVTEIPHPFILLPLFRNLIFRIEKILKYLIYRYDYRPSIVWEQVILLACHKLCIPSLDNQMANVKEATEYRTKIPSKTGSKLVEQVRHHAMLSCVRRIFWELCCSSILDWQLSVLLEWKLKVCQCIDNETYLS